MHELWFISWQGTIVQAQYNNVWTLPGKTAWISIAGQSGGFPVTFMRQEMEAGTKF